MYVAMATSDQPDGGLNWCAYCNQRLTIVDGTDPDDAEDGFSERYECPNGHTGTYSYHYQSGREDFSGACR